MFARASGQPLRDIIEWWHPSDVDTWIELNMIESEEPHWAQLRQEHREAQGR